jgi:hypothetical protein
MSHVTVSPRRTRLPFFYGWVLVGVAFVTMAVGVNARTAFSLLFPPILDPRGTVEKRVAMAEKPRDLRSEGLRLAMRTWVGSTKRERS